MIQAVLKYSEYQLMIFTFIKSKKKRTYNALISSYIERNDMASIRQHAFQLSNWLETTKRKSLI